MRSRFRRAGILERVIHISVFGGSNPVPSFLISPAALDLPDFFTVLPTLDDVALV
jgi:hypothetical protein